MGNKLPPQKGDGAPSAIIGPFLLWPNGWMHQDATWYEGSPHPRRLRVRWGPRSPSPKWAPLIFGQCPLWPNGCMDALLLILDQRIIRRKAPPSVWNLSVYLMCLITASRGTAEIEHIEQAESFRTEHGALRCVGMRHPVITNLSRMYVCFSCFCIINVLLILCNPSVFVICALKNYLLTYLLTYYLKFVTARQTT